MQWIIAYIAEAHAIDEWPVPSSRYQPEGQAVTVKQTLTTQQRTVQAKEFLSVFGLYDKEEDRPTIPSFKVYVAPPERDLGVSFEEIYRPWPFRALCFVGDKASWFSEPRACEFRIDELTTWLGVTVE